MPRRPAPEDAPQPPAAQEDAPQPTAAQEDAPQPPAAQEAARLLLRLVPVAVPLVLFVLIVARGIEPALRKRARLLGDLEKEERRYKLARERLDTAEAERAELEDPVGRERRRRRRPDAGASPAPPRQKGR